MAARTVFASGAADESFRIELDRVATDRVAFAVESEGARIADGTFIVQETL